MATVEAERANHQRVIEVAYRKFLALIECIPEAEMLEPGTVGEWSGKDVIADVAGWERAVLRYIEARDRGWLGYLPPAEEDGAWDRFNQSNVDPAHEWSLEEVKADFARTHYTFMRVAAATDHTNWQSVVRITKTHYEEHTEDLKGIHAKVRARQDGELSSVLPPDPEGRQSPRAATAESATR